MYTAFEAESALTGNRRDCAGDGHSTHRLAAR